MSRVLPILALLISIALVFFYIVPTWNGQISQEKAQIASFDSALVAATIFTQKENQLIGEENAIPPASLTRLETYLPDGVNNVQLILDLNALAEKSGITLSDFNVENGGGDAAAAASGQPQPTSLINSLTLSVSAVGTYAAFQTFLAATEQSLRPMDVTSLSLTDSSTGVYTYGITYRIYWLQ